MKTFLPVTALFNLVVTAVLFIGSPLVQGDSDALSKTKVKPDDSVSIQGYSRENDENTRQDVECKSTAKGIRCRNQITGKASLINSSDMADNDHYQARVEEICQNSSRGSRCMQQVKIMLMEITGQELAFTEESACKFTSRGSRC